MARTPVLNVTTLRRLRALPWASDRQLEQLLPHLTLQRAERQATLFAEGEQGHFLYLLIAGAAKLTLRSAEGEEILVSLIAPGEFFGITCLLSESSRGFHCEAFSDCWIAAIRPDTFVTTLLGVPFAEFSGFMSSTVSRWAALLDRYSRFQGLGLQQRLAFALLELAQKFGVQDDRGTILVLQLTHDDLANLVGASRQKVTEHIKELERREALLRDGRRLIVAPERLQIIAGLAVTRVGGEVEGR
ncbi:MAG: Crp/Fnr family transcriptional regulator [Deltaproteobacteria bacterium]|nr:Crp/Fnr family transcriptional regulator [Deltaproteobacteria bacterium]